MKVQWVELSPHKKKALHMILKDMDKTFDEISASAGFGRQSLSNKLGKVSRFKQDEYQRILEVLGITDEVLEDFAQGSLIEFLLKKSSTCGSKA
ncbi:MAG: hypothetical protein E6590_17865 [Clostridiales bacterium]|nr:hypothetical protein [Clostridiales bacterium]